MKVTVFMLVLILYALRALANADYLTELFQKPDEHGDGVDYIYTSNKTVSIETIPLEDTKTLVVVLENTKSCQKVYLDFLWDLPQLEDLWITHSSNERCHVYEAELYISKAIDSKNINLKSLHINVNIRRFHHSFGHLIKVLSKAQSLEVLDLSRSWIWDSDEFYTLFENICTRNLSAISLKQVLSADYGSLIGFALNLTRLLQPVTQQPIQYLDISYNNIMKLRGSLTYLTPSLKYFDSSFNRLFSEAGTLFTTDADNMIIIIELIFLHQSIERVYCRGQTIIFKQQMCQSSIHQLTRMKRSIIWPKITDCFTQYNTTINKLINNSTQNESCYFLKHCAFHMLFVGGLKYEDFSIEDIPCDIIPSILDILKWKSGACEQGFIIPLAPMLQEIDPSSFGTYFFEWSVHDNKKRTYCFQQNNLKKIWLSDFEPLIAFPSFVYKFKVYGLSNFEFLDLTNNRLPINFRNNIFLSFPTMTDILLGSNLINFTGTNFIADAFPKLKEFDISYNNLTEENIPVSLFRNLTNLESLHISGNIINVIDIDIIDNNNLQFINMSFNRIQYFGPSTLYSLKITRNKTLSVDLSGNRLLCTCEPLAIETTELIKTAACYNITFVKKNIYTCSGELSVQKLLDIDITALRKNCNPSNTVTIVATTLLNLLAFTIIVSSYLGYKYRYRMYTSYFHLKQYFSRKNIEKASKYDAFISYCAEDRFWVHNILMKELENNYGFKLCIHYRDFMPGEAIADQIVETISDSRSIVAIVSNNFIESHWCDYELQIGHEQSLRCDKKLIIVKLEDIKLHPGSKASSLLKQLLDSRVYIEWPEYDTNVEYNDTSELTTNKNIQDKKCLFWAKLSQRMYGKSVDSQICGCFPFKQFSYDKIDSITRNGADDDYSVDESGDSDSLLLDL